MLRVARNDAEKNNIAFKSLDVVRQCASKLFKTAESGVDKVVSSCEKNPSVHWRYMNFLRQRKTALDVPLYAVSAGRSMIEMLGVLAIVGVLSVGGIAGYSKAMEKFKITKAVGEYNMLVQGLVEHLSDLKKLNAGGNVYGIADTIQALGLVPDNWPIEQNTANHNASFLDAYGNHSSLFSRGNRVVFSIGIGGANYDADGAATTPAFSSKFCEEIMTNVFAPLHSFIFFTGVWRSGDGHNDAANYWRGDKYCKGSNQRCLASITPQQINEVCKKCTGATESCSVTVEME